MSEQKKALVPKGAETPIVVADPLAQATGASDPEVAARLAQQVISVLSTANLEKEEEKRRVRSALSLLKQIEPQNELEGLLALQILGVHETAMECLQQSRLPDRVNVPLLPPLLLVAHSVKYLSLLAGSQP